MHPVLFHYGFITIHTYGFLIAIAFYAGISLASTKAKKEGIDPEKIMDLGIYIIVCSVIGGRLFFVLRNYEMFVDAPLDAFKVWQGGLVFYGGLLLVVPVSIWYVKKHSLPTIRCMDITAPYISLGQSIGRLGCFSSGCCYGAPSKLPWAVTYTSQNSLAPLNVTLHPSQIYSSIMNLAIFFALLWLYKRKKFDGQVFSFYLIFYAIARFTVENFRSDPRGSVNLIGVSLSTSQVISIFIFTSGLLFLTFCKKRAAGNNISVSGSK